MTNDHRITGHMIVKNEDCFVWYAVNSALPFLEKLIIYDTGSTDRTVEIIKSVKNPKIEFAQKGKVGPKELVNLRRDQIRRTRTELFFLLDGDEIWPEKNLQIFFQKATRMSKNKLAAFCRTRNAVGDIWHYLPDDAGQYKLAGRKGHYNIRLFKKTAGIDIVGRYPLEAYTFAGRPVNDLPDKLEFIDVWYLHATHLRRSTETSGHVAGPSRRSKIKFEMGIPLARTDLPEVFFHPKPETVPDPLVRRSTSYFFRSLVETPLRRLHRKLL